MSPFGARLSQAREEPVQSIRHRFATGRKKEDSVAGGKQIREILGDEIRGGCQLLF